MTDVLALPFDQYQRYRLAADLLDEVRPDGTLWSILDVGGRTAILRGFLPKDRVTLVDLESSTEPGLVLGDGSALPFARASFDVVTAFDTLEHVPPARRAAFVAECRRVARRYVLVVGPYSAPDVLEAERLLQRFLKDKLSVEHRYLEEHRRHGLPVRNLVESWLSASGAAVASVAHGNLERWLALICASMYMDYNPELRGIAAHFFRFYNDKLYRSDHAAPVYRHAVVAALDGAPLPAGRGALGPPLTPAGAVGRITELGFELVAFERLQAAWVRERDELRHVVLDLSQDLAGHRAALEDLRRKVAYLQRAQAGKVEERALLLAELDLERAEISRMRAELQAAAQVLTQNDAKITELRAELHGRWKSFRRAFGPRRAIP